MSTDPLRAALRDAAPEPPTEGDLVAAVASRVRRHQRQRRAAAGVVGATCALALAAVLLHRTDRGTVNVAAPTSPPTVTAEPPLAPCAARGPRIGTLPYRTGGSFDRRPLVAPGATAAQVCRYAGLDETLPAATLAGSATLRGARLRNLVGDIRGLTLVDPRLPERFCPADTGALDTVTLRYEHRPAVHLTVQLGGCAYVSDGTRRAFSYGPGDAQTSGPPRLQRALAAAVGP